MRRINYKKIVPEDTFIGRYMQYMEAQETPYAFDFWCAVWALGTILGRDVFVDRPRAPVFMNWYVLLVGDSAVARKTTAIKSIIRIARRHITMPTIETRITAEQLEYDLHDDAIEHGRSQRAIVIPELVTFLGRNVSARGMPGLLTDLYDCPDTRSGGGTVGRGELVARDVYVSFLSASTASWLGTAMHRDTVEGGFTSRVIIVSSDDRKRRIAWPEANEDDNQTYHAVIRDELLGICGEIADHARIALTDDALRKFRSWYNTRALGSDPYLSSFEGREDSHVLRLAAILAVNTRRWTIGTVHIRDAIKIIGEVKRDGARLFENIEADSSLYAAIIKVREMLISHGAGGCTKSVLFRSVKHYIPNYALTQLLAIMHENRLVYHHEVRVPGKRGAPAQLYTPAPALYDAKAFEHVWKLWSAT